MELGLQWLQIQVQLKQSKMDQIQEMKQGNLGFDVGKCKAREKQIKPGLNNTMTKWGSSKIIPG